jgi:hypothetical protein
VRAHCTALKPSPTAKSPSRRHPRPEQQRRALIDEIARLITTGKLHAPIHASYDVSQIKEAGTAAASGERSGKILVVLNGERARERDLLISQHNRLPLPLPISGRPA